MVKPLSVLIKDEPHVPKWHLLAAMIALIKMA